MPGDPTENGGENPPEPVEETSAAQEWGRFAIQAGYLVGGGFQMAATTVAGYLAGRWIDGKTGTGVFAPALAILGFVAGVYSLVRVLRRLSRRQEPTR